MAIINGVPVKSPADVEREAKLKLAAAIAALQGKTDDQSLVNEEVRQLKEIVESHVQNMVGTKP